MEFYVIFGQNWVHFWELASILDFLRQLLLVSRSVILIQKWFESEASLTKIFGASTLASGSPRGDTTSKAMMAAARIFSIITKFKNPEQARQNRVLGTSLYVGSNRVRSQ